MSQLGFVEGSGLAASVSDLDGRVPVTVLRLELNDPHRCDPDDRDRDGTVLVIPDLAHADLFADYRFRWHS
jgi:hypothetical protein